ncbi:hypothetical protein KKB84_04730 [bacterium]|nr:hypothetical protein [bacterium]MBU2600482.1 hypothetical protein [bacterium]
MVLNYNKIRDYLQKERLVGLREEKNSEVGLIKEELSSEELKDLRTEISRLQAIYDALSNGQVLS